MTSSAPASAGTVSRAYTVLCTYLVQPDRVEEFHELLRRHWPTLRKYRLVTDEPAVIYFGEDSSGPFFVEILTWIDDTATARAYHTQEICDIWTGLYAFTEPRGDRPAIEYPSVEVQDYFRNLPAASEDTAARWTNDLPSAEEWTVERWDRLYLSGRYADAWELGGGSPELAMFLATHRGSGDARALDVGCGTGWDCILLARAGYRAHGVDLSPEAIRVARGRAADEQADVVLQTADALALPFEDGYFTLATDRGCFHHLGERERERYAAELARVLTDGGLLFLRGCRVTQDPFVAVTSELVHRYFTEPRFTVESLTEIELVTDSQLLPANQCVIRRTGAHSGSN